MILAIRSLLAFSFAMLAMQDIALAQPLGLVAEHDYICKVRVSETSPAVSDTVYLTVFWEPATHTGHRTPPRQKLILRTQPDYNYGLRLPKGRSNTPLESFLSSHTSWGGTTYGRNFELGLSLDLRLSKDLPGSTAPTQPYDLSDFDQFASADSGLNGTVTVAKAATGFDISLDYFVNGKLDFNLSGTCF